MTSDLQRFAEDLQHFNDTMLRTPMAGRYWAWGGLVLGWYRDGGLMPHDTGDVDFVYRADDEQLLLDSFAVLLDAGFTYHHRFPGIDGEATEHCFERRGAKFEFFAVTQVDDQWHYCNYAMDADGVGVRNRCAIPAQPLEEFTLVGRRWLRSADTDLELTSLYGDWRTPDPGYDYRNSPALLSTEPWDPSTFDLRQLAPDAPEWQRLLPNAAAVVA